MILHSLVAVQAYHATQGSRFTGKQGVVRAGVCGELADPVFVRCSLSPTILAGAQACNEGPQELVPESAAGC
jgi:hypothetical protein